MKYVDILGRPLADMYEWAALFEDMHYRRVNESTIGDVYVSTVWLGTAMGDGLIFETMIFGGSRSQECWRYRTHAEACAGHDQVVALLLTQARL